MITNSTVIRLKNNPPGQPKEDDFEFDNTYKIPAILKENRVVLKALWISVDPYIRGRLYSTKIGSIINSPQCAQVIKSNSKNLKVGDIIVGNFKWSSYSVFTDKPKVYTKVVPASNVQPNMDLAKYLGPLGLIGVTAYQGLFDIGKLRKGENVFVSGAAGAVGSIVGQIAKNVMGCKVIGIAGSDDKCKWLTEELGFDAALNYKKYNNNSNKLQKDLRKLFRSGIDVYFDNTGGFITGSIWSLLNYKGRVIVCGQIANYNRLRNIPKIDDFLFRLIYQHIRVEGFAINSFTRYMDFYRDMNKWTKEGKIKFRKTVKVGLNAVPSAFIGLFTGENYGKMLVKISDPIIQSKL